MPASTRPDQAPEPVAGWHHAPPGCLLLNRSPSILSIPSATASMASLLLNCWSTKSGQDQSIFCRLADPTHHREAITTRPTLLHRVIRQTTHSNQGILTITSTNGNKATITSCFNRGSS